MRYSPAIWKYGLVPVYRRLNEEENRRSLIGRWRHVHEYPIILKKEPHNRMSLTWRHMSLGPGEELQFAFFHPWNIEHNIEWTYRIMNRVQRTQDMYIHVETLGQSEFDTPIQAFHISGLEGMSNSSFSNIKGLFPNKDEDRAFKFPEKRYIFIMGRTLAFGTPSNLVIKGFVDSLFGDNENTLDFLKQFVIVVVPIVNIDGANLGQTINSANGENLEDSFSNIVPGSPLYFVQKYVQNLQKEAKLYMILDINSHLHTPYPEIYGKNFTPKNALQILSLPYLLCLHHKHLKLPTGTNAVFDSRERRGLKRDYENIVLDEKDR